MRITRRGLQLGLGGLWLLDAALQYQPFMFGRGFATDVLAPAADGQPLLVSGPVAWTAHVVGQHAVVANAVFATVQLLLALGLFSRRTTRAALAGSVAWGLGIWWLGEGFGGLLGGHATLPDGAPGAALLYAVVAAAAYPDRGVGRGESPRRPALVAWVVLWLMGAVLEPFGDRRGWSLVALVGVQAAIGLAALRPGRMRWLSGLAGDVFAVAIWLTVQAYGELATGQSTDPNTAPLLVLLGLAVAWPAVTRSGQAPSALEVAYREEPRLRELDARLTPAAG